jgi:hypothetical protein
VQYEEAKEFADSLGKRYFEVSATAARNIHTPIASLAYEHLERTEERVNTLKRPKPAPYKTQKCNMM